MQRRLLPLLLLCGLVAVNTCQLGCQKEATATPPDPNRIIWRQLAMNMADNAIERVALLRVEDKVTHSPDVERQVQQAILSELTLLPNLMVVESDPLALETSLKAQNLDLALGIPAPAAKQLCIDLNVGAIIYASVENTEYDVNLKMYAAEPGTVIFTKTLDNLQLPGGAGVAAEPPLDPGLLTETLAQGDAAEGTPAS